MRRLLPPLTALTILAACGACNRPVDHSTALNANQIPQREPETYTRWERGDEFNPPPSTTTTARASRSRTRTTTAAPRAYGVRLVSSTAYCLRTPTADGGRGYVGSAAMNGVPLGSRWRVVETGREYTINDRIGHGSGFDIWMPTCEAAIQYGRRTITVERVA